MLYIKLIITDYAFPSKPIEKCQPSQSTRLTHLSTTLTRLLGEAEATGIEEGHRIRTARA